MPIWKSEARSDPRLLCKLIALTTLEQLDAPQDPNNQDTSQLYAASLLRVLNAYRFGLPEVTPHKGVAEFTPFDQAEDDVWSEDSGHSEVMSAIERARKRLSPKQTPDSYATMLSTALKGTFGLSNDSATSDSVRALRLFLSQFSSELRPDARAV